jgi:Ni/Co efflux regulator RcnB
MRNFALALLLAGTAFTPALAQRHDRDSSQREESRSERSQSHEDRSQARQERSEAREQARAARVEKVERVQVDHVQHVEGNRDRPVFDRGGNSAETDHSPAQAQDQIEARRNSLRERVRDRSRDTDAEQANVNERGRPVIRQDADQDSVANFRRERGKQDIGQRVGQHEGRRVRVPEGARPDRPAPLPQTAQHRDRRGDHHWRTDWRKNNHYDWRKHRRHHRSIFHLGFYFDPFGWGYHRYGIGWRLWPSYYSSNYWLNDPYQYRLPYAPYPYRWVRYYNDALLVDTFTGQVVDVIYDFYW